MSTIFRTFVNYREQPPSTEVLDPVSLTQPNEVLSIREMMDRHVRGLPLSGNSQPGNYYPEDFGYVPSIQDLDLSEIDDYRQHYSRIVDDLRAREESLRNSPPPAEGGRPPEAREPLGDSAGDVES